MYCGSGVTACHNLLAMEHAGLRGARFFPAPGANGRATRSDQLKRDPSSSASVQTQSADGKAAAARRLISP